MTEIPPITLRAMVQGDYAAAAMLWRETEMMGLGDGDDSDGIARYLERNPGLSTVAIANDQLIGTLLAGHDGRRAWLHHLAVAREWRCRGIGRALVETTLRALNAQDLFNIRLMIYNDNAVGREFWQKLGWRTAADRVAMMYLDMNRGDECDGPC